MEETKQELQELINSLDIDGLDSDQIKDLFYQTMEEFINSNFEIQIGEDYEEEVLPAKNSNKGKKWTVEEENQLLGYVKSGKTFQDITKIMGRTKTALISRFCKLMRSQKVYRIEQLPKKYKINDQKDFNYIKKTFEGKTWSKSQKSEDQFFQKLEEDMKQLKDSNPMKNISENPKKIKTNVAVLF